MLAAWVDHCRTQECARCADQAANPLRAEIPHVAAPFPEMTEGRRRDRQRPVPKLLGAERLLRRASDADVHLTSMAMGSAGQGEKPSKFLDRFVSGMAPVLQPALCQVPGSPAKTASGR